MTPSEFVKKWAASQGGERATSQEHFIDLCRLLGEKPPTEADPNRDIYAFEKGAKTPDGNGFADVWLKGHFAWEYKAKRKDLAAAYKQVQTYREALGNPPLLVVSDIDRYEVHTNWTNTETWIYKFRNENIASDANVEITTVSGPAKDAPALTALQVLKALFENPERLKPQKTTEQITRKAAALFGEISYVLRKRKVDDMRIARFVTRVMFCMFATDVGLLPRESFTDIVTFHKTSGDNKAFREHLSDLFGRMRTGGELFMRRIPHFNGRLFDDDDVPDEITTQEILTLAELNQLNWTDVEPSIFGTLFERVLDPNQRQKLGAHFTSRADVELIVEPVLMAPLRREWEEVQTTAETLLNPSEGKKKPAKRKAGTILRKYHSLISNIRVLDPACGSGNFLYVSLALLKALEKEVIAFAGLHDITISPRVHPRQLFGIETNPFAHELSSIVLWIGYLQWKHRNAMPLDDEEPILEPLDQITLMDAIVDSSDPAQPQQPEWPEADVIMGNPPFLGGKRLRTVLGDEYVDRMFAAWDGRVARESDLCCYWFEQAREAIESRRTQRVGLLATQAIRGGANRRTLQRIKETGDIFYAQADRKWMQDGVAVRVSMVGFDDGSETHRLLNERTDDLPEHALNNARPVEGININLTHGFDITTARRLKENIGISFMGDTKVGPFDIPESLARRLLASPNPHGKPNSDVVRPWVNGLDITRRPRGMWIVDFPAGMSEVEAAKYQAPFEHVKKHVRPTRIKNSRKLYAERWWIHGEARPDMREALVGLARYIVTPRVTRHRLFVWVGAEVLCDSATIVFARDNAYLFGLLHSRVHELWARSAGTQLREAASGFRYTPKTCFETFPFPKLQADQRAKIAEAAKELNELRNEWLNPQMTPGVGTEKTLKKRTLTNLYNERPTWLVNAHRDLDEAVMAAYGWTDDPDESEVLARLLRLNLEREAVE